MSINLVLATNNDVEEIVLLVQSVYRGESSLQGWTSEAHFLDGQRIDGSMVRELLDRENSVILLYRENQTLQACVHLEKEGERAHLGMLSVSAHLQGQKAGQRILKYCESFVREHWMAHEIQIEVLNPREELMAWYERRGFLKTGKTLPFPQDPKFGIPKVKGLYFFEMVKRI